MMPPYAQWNHTEWAEYFSGDLTNSVNNDIRPLIPNGLFGVPRQFFPYIEYLSGLVHGPVSSHDLSNTPQAIRFLEDYLSRVDLGYRRHSHHLLEIWRHGLVHTYKPKILQHPNAVRLLGWFSYSGPRTTLQAEHAILGFKTAVCHLQVISNPNGSLDWLPVSIDCLVSDLVTVLALLAADLDAEQQVGGTLLLDKMRQAATLLARPKPTTHPW